MTRIYQLKVMILYQLNLTPSLLREIHIIWCIILFGDIMARKAVVFRINSTSGGRNILEGEANWNFSPYECYLFSMLSYSRRQKKKNIQIPFRSTAIKISIFIVVITVAFCAILNKWPTPFTKTVKNGWAFPSIHQYFLARNSSIAISALYQLLNTWDSANNSYNNPTASIMLADWNYYGHTTLIRSKVYDKWKRLNGNTVKQNNRILPNGVTIPPSSPPIFVILWLPLYGTGSGTFWRLILIL